jgi:hypothetical protein
MSLCTRIKKQLANANPDQLDWLKDQMEVPYVENPCMRLYGPGPEGAKCKTCALLFCHSRSKRYYKCSLRGCTHGPGTDHRVNWPACSKYEPKKK